MLLVQGLSETGLTIADENEEQNVGEESLEDFKISRLLEEQGTVKEQFRPDPKQVDIEKNSNVEESDQTLIKIMLKQQLLMIKPSEPTLGDHNRQLAAGSGSIRSSFPASHQHHLL